MIEAKVLQISQVCHEAIRAWCAANNDFSIQPWEEAEAWRKNATIVGVQHRINNPQEKPDAQHLRWLEHKMMEGWVYGEEKNDKLKTHPCIVPYQGLSDFEKKKDALFCAVVDVLK
jgi:RyR domain